MTDEQKQQFLNGLLNGAQIHNMQLNAVVESGATVVYQQVTAPQPEQGTVHLHVHGVEVAAQPSAAATCGVADCFAQGMLDPLQPNQLFLLLLAMRARRKWMEREIPAFVDMVAGNFAELEQYYGKTKEQLVYCIRKLHNKAAHFFYDNVNDQASMKSFIDELYPLKCNGERSKAGENAQMLAEKLYLLL